jgi:dephospho-CoA kinase
LLHPRIVAAMRRALDDAEAEDTPLVVVDAALLLELGLDTWCEAVLDVESTLEQQIARLVARNGLSSKAAGQRVAAQWSPEQRRSRATWTVENVGTLAELDASLLDVWRGLLERCPELAELPGS